jgi:hypothetical protein
MPVDVSGPMPSDTGGLVLAEVLRSGDVGHSDKVVTSNVGKFEFTLAVVLVDEVKPVTGIVKVVVIGIRVPCVLVASVTSMGLSSSPVVGDVVGSVESGLDTSTVNLSRVSEIVVLGKTELGDQLRTEDGTASGITDGIHESLSPPPESALQSGDGLAHALNKHLTTVVSVNKLVTDSAVSVPSLLGGVETSVGVHADFVVIIVNVSLETDVVDTVGSGLLARLTSQVLKRTAAGALRVDAGDVIIFVILELLPLISPSHLPIKGLVEHFVIVVSPTSTSNSPRAIEIAPITSVSLGKGGKAYCHKG